jgi:hypothetical protein
MTVEKKGQDSYQIPFKESPKISITTNYTIKGEGSSHARRVFEVEVANHYNADNTPEDEFGHQFFSEWSEEEWRKFDNYMINCLSSYLNTGLVKSKFINLRIRQLSAETSYEFIEWVGLVKETSNNIRFGARLYKQSLYYDFIEENPDYGPKSKFTISRNKFYNWLDAYSKYLSKNINDGRDNVGKWIMFEEKEN